METAPSLAPSNMAALKEDIRGGRIMVPKALVGLAQYALANPKDVAFMTCRELAEAAGGSPASVIRLSRIFGFRGFVEFRDLLRREFGRRG